MADFLLGNEPASLIGRQTVLNRRFEDQTLDDTFTLLTYNTLADCHVQRTDYSYTDNTALPWERRYQIVSQELSALNADVICMQEVSPDVYSSTLKPNFDKLGFESLYIKRTSELYDEGCATFYRKSKFQCLNSETCILGELAGKNVSLCNFTPAEQELVSKKYVNRPDVAIITTLKNRCTGCVVTVGNVHIAFADMKEPDLQSLQIADVKKRMLEISPSGHHVLCGDFNVFPDTPPYVIATSGSLDVSLVTKICEEAKLEDKMRPQFLQLITKSLDDGPPMTSAYREIMGHEPEVTCVDGIWQCTPDFVLYRDCCENQTTTSSGQLPRLVPLQVLDTHPLTEIQKSLPPSAVYPSDHMPLFVRFGISEEQDA